MPEASNLPALRPLELSQPLAQAIGAFETPHPEAPPDPPPAWMMAEVRRAHRHLSDALGPTDAGTIARWIVPLATLVSRAPEGDALRIRVQAMAHALTDLPACCWTPETQRQAARTFRFWPSVAEISDLVAPAAQPLRQQRAALQRMMFIKPKQQRGSPEERAETPEERAAHAERNRAMIEAMKARLEAEAASGVAKTRPAHLPPAVLVGAYRKAGLHGRADALAAALGVPEAAPADAGESRPPSMPLG